MYHTEDVGGRKPDKNDNTLMGLVSSASTVCIHHKSASILRNIWNYKVSTESRTAPPSPGALQSAVSSTAQSLSQPMMQGFYTVSNLHSFRWLSGSGVCVRRHSELTQDVCTRSPASSGKLVIHSSCFSILVEKVKLEQLQAVPDDFAQL